MAIDNLSELERRTYEIIKRVGEIRPKDLPEPRMIGAVSSLKEKGLVTIFKQYTSRAHKRKKKFVSLREDQPEDRT